jgi:hypothetical protein
MLRLISGSVPVSPAVTRAEQIAILDAAEHEGMGVAIFLVHATGMRLSELLGQRWSDVDLDSGLLRLSEQLDPLGPDLRRCWQCQKQAQQDKDRNRDLREQRHAGLGVARPVDAASGAQLPRVMTAVSRRGTATHHVPHRPPERRDDLHRQLDSAVAVRGPQHCDVLSDVRARSRGARSFASCAVRTPDLLIRGVSASMRRRCDLRLCAATARADSWPSRVCRGPSAAQILPGDNPSNPS